MNWFQTDAPIQYSVTARTHVGCVRSQNEDSYSINSDANLYVVADGMGGYEKGDAASQILCKALARLSRPSTLGQLVDQIELCVGKANQDILQFSERECEGRTIGSTLVTFVANQRSGACLWAGDSRCYRFRQGNLEQLSHDHSQVAELVRLGHLTPEEARGHPHANLITRAVGTSEKTQLDLILIDIEAGDKFLLCTDGLYNEVEDREIASILSSKDSEAAADQMLSLCLDRGARDNVTFMLIDAD